ncbi:MAG: nicotinamide riboside transporter PnuC [Burkholderiales bacterium]
MNPLEAAGTALGLLNLWLTRQQNILCWPVGIACVLCFAFVFHEARLYSDMLLQYVYVGLQAWGWWLWARGGRDRLVSRSPIRKLSRMTFLVCLAVCAAVAFLLGNLMATATRADLPYLDATATAGSLIAQYLQAKKVLESWLIFCAANLVFIGIYLAKGLYLTAALFVASTMLALSGYLTWRQRLEATAGR